MPKMLDFQSFGEELWRIANVFRDDTLKTTEYLEEFSYFFFLKLWDERERGEEKELEELNAGHYVPYLPKEMRFYAWAEEMVATSPDQFCKRHNCESLVAFVQNLFATAGRYCPHQAAAEEHDPPEILVNRLLDLEREIQCDLEELLAMISVPKTAAGLKGAFRFSAEPDTEGTDA